MNNTDAERLRCEDACARLLTYNGICLTLNVLACPATHLCVTLGKKARLHLKFSPAKAKSCHLY